MPALLKLSRTFLSSPFVISGLDACINPEEHRIQGEKFAQWMQKGGIELPIEKHLPFITRSSGLVMIAAGIAVAKGCFPRLSATTLLALQLPISLARHPFWEKHGNERRLAILHLASEAGMLGGLISQAKSRQK